MFPPGYPVLDNEVSGRCRCMPLQPGLQVQAVDINLPQSLCVTFNRNEPHMEFGCLFSGRLHGSSKINNGREQYFTNDPGNVWCSFCNDAQGCIEFPSGSPVYSVSFIVYGALLKSILSIEGIISANHFSSQTCKDFQMVKTLSPGVRRTASMITDALSQQEPLQNLFLISKAYELLSQIFTIRECETTVAGTDQKRDAINYARGILDKDLVSPPCLEQLARKSGLCVTHLTEEFKKTFGVTVFGYVRQQRLLRAKELIAVHGFSASDAAWEVGYSSLSAFHRAFIAEFGTTPGSYRQKLKNIT